MNAGPSMSATKPVGSAIAASRVALSSRLKDSIGSSSAMISAVRVVLPTCLAPATNTIRESCSASTINGLISRG